MIAFGYVFRLAFAPVASPETKEWCAGFPTFRRFRNARGRLGRWPTARKHSHCMATFEGSPSRRARDAGKAGVGRVGLVALDWLLPLGFKALGLS